MHGGFAPAALIVQILALVRRHVSTAKPPDVGLADVVDADKSQNAGYRAMAIVGPDVVGVL